MTATVFKNIYDEIDVYLQENDKTTSIHKCTDVKVSINDNSFELGLTIPVDGISFINS